MQKNDHKVSVIPTESDECEVLTTLKSQLIKAKGLIQKLTEE